MFDDISVVRPTSAIYVTALLSYFCCLLEFWKRMSLVFGMGLVHSLFHCSIVPSSTRVFHIGGTRVGASLPGAKRSEGQSPLLSDYSMVPDRIVEPPFGELFLLVSYPIGPNKGSAILSGTVKNHDEKIFLVHLRMHIVDSPGLTRSQGLSHCSRSLEKLRVFPRLINLVQAFASL